jgi:hypothetical protein
MDVKGMQSRVGSLVSLPLALLLLIFFFLPWVNVTCAGQKIGHASGLQLTLGQWSTDMPSPEGGKEDSGPRARPWFIICLLVCLALLAVGAMGGAGRMGAAPAGKALIALGILGVIMMVVAANVDFSDDIKGSMKEEGGTSGTDPGDQMAKAMQSKAAEGIKTETAGILWASLVLYLLVAGCGAANLVLSKALPEPITAEPAPPPPPVQT